MNLQGADLSVPTRGEAFCFLLRSSQRPCLTNSVHRFTWTDREHGLSRIARFFNTYFFYVIILLWVYAVVCSLATCYTRTFEIIAVKQEKH